MSVSSGLAAEGLLCDGFVPRSPLIRYVRELTETEQGVETGIVVPFRFLSQSATSSAFRKGGVMASKKTTQEKKERKLRKKLEKKYQKLEKKLRVLELKLRKLANKKAASKAGKPVAAKRKKKRVEPMQPARSESGSQPMSPNIVSLPTDE